MAPIKRALLSVSDKAGIVDFARELNALGVEIVSTGGTAKSLAEAGIPVKAIADLTHFPEMLDGRVKTLHPAVHGGILARRDLPEHIKTIEEHGIAPIDLVCVNLYPFAATVAKPGVSIEDAIENIDIGGPAMIRSAAKNHDAVTVLVDAADYAAVLDEMRAEGGTTSQTRRALAAKAYAHTARYDATISGFLRSRFTPDALFPKELGLGYEWAQTCRYGENPHQAAAFYRDTSISEPCVAAGNQLHGKELSFNNFMDANAALETVKEFVDRPAAVIIKHANPCGVALADTLADAVRLAREADPVSAFGGILAVNKTVDLEAAQAITVKNTFFEAIVAPSYAPDALELITGRKGWGADVRVIEVGSLDGWQPSVGSLDTRKIVGGLLVQERDLRQVTAADLKVVTDRAPTPEEIAELLFAWKVVRHAKSNAIVFTKDRQIVGVGAGQMNRVQSVRLAVNQAGEKARGAVMASDAFFPFPDGPEAAIAAGITAIIQPGGSKKDQETVDMCNAHGVAMVYTGVRHFLH